MIISPSYLKDQRVISKITIKKYAKGDHDIEKHDQRITWLFFLPIIVLVHIMK